MVKPSYTSECSTDGKEPVALFVRLGQYTRPIDIRLMHNLNTSTSYTRSFSTCCRLREVDGDLRFSALEKKSLRLASFMS
jgi:hypothetical protein